MITWADFFNNPQTVFITVQAIATLALVGGIFYASRQIKLTQSQLELSQRQIEEARKNTQAQVAFQLFDHFRTEESLTELQAIYNNQETITPESNIDTKQSAERVADRLNLIGTLVHNKIINEELAIEGFAGPASLRTWYQLASYVLNQQELRGYYSNNFEDFAKKSLEHFNKKAIHIYFNPNDDNKIDLTNLKIYNDQHPLPRHLDEILKDQNTQINKGE